MAINAYEADSKEDNSKKGNEVQKLVADLSSTKESLKQEENLKILADQKREDMKSKLSKCRENCRSVEEAKKTLENDYKVLLQENRNAASEIKTLKSHLSSSRAIVVEKTAVKDEFAKMKSDLTSKTIELEKNNIKMRKLQESKSHQEVENKNLKEKMKSLKGGDGRGESKELESKLKVKEEEVKTLSSKVKGFDESKKELEERLEFYLQQCSVFEKNDMRHQEEILVLQVSPWYLNISTVLTLITSGQHQDLHHGVLGETGEGEGDHQVPGGGHVVLQATGGGPDWQCRGRAGPDDRAGGRQGAPAEVRRPVRPDGRDAQEAGAAQRSAEEERLGDRKLPEEVGLRLRSWDPDVSGYRPSFQRDLSSGHERLVC